MGTFLGTMMTSNEAIIGLPNGDVTRPRSVARLVPSQRWRPEVMLKITGTRIRQAINDLARRGLGPAAAPFPSEALSGNAALAAPEHANAAARYFNNRKISIYGGSNEIQANILAKHVLDI